ncbi:MAG: acyl-CoA dehydrogenase family protein [Chloroflexi bacterium]|nr:acyl-CoA dehydrogenase family protein [Chloroflexota bacterium]
MVDFTPSPRAQKAVEGIRHFISQVVRPKEEEIAEHLQDSRKYLDAEGKLHPRVWEARKEIYRRSGEVGYYSLHLPTTVGGGGFNRAEMLVIEEEVYSHGVGLNPAVLGWRDGPTPRVMFCVPEMRPRFVEPLVKGLMTSFHAVTEPDVGSDMMNMKATAVKDGDDWVLNGHKAFTTNAFNADIANVLVVTDPGKGRRSLTYFQFLTREHEGKGFRRGNLYQTIMDDGYTGEVMLENLRLPKNAVLGEVGQGFDIFLPSINWTRISRGGMCSGWSKYLIDRTVERAKSRQLYGKPLGSLQAIQWMISDMYVDWYGARALSLQAVAEIDQMGPWYEMPKPPEFIRLIAMVKVANDEAFYRIADRAVQIHGGVGLLKDTTINKLFRIARNLRVPGGSDEVQRATIAQTFGLR